RRRRSGRGGLADVRSRVGRRHPRGGGAGAAAVPRRGDGAVRAPWRDVAAGGVPAMTLLFTPSPPLGAERAGVRWGIPETSERAHLTLPRLRRAPASPPMGGEGSRGARHR